MTFVQLVLFLLGAAALFLLPGMLLLWKVPFFRQRIGAGEKLLPAFLLSAGILDLVYLAALLVRPTVSFALALWLSLLALLALLQIARRRGGGAGPRLEVPPGRGLAAAAVLLAVVVGGIVLQDGGSLGYIHDSLDFVAFVKRMLLTGRIDLASGSYEDLRGLSPDPRRGAFHLGAALLCRMTGTPPDEMWRSFPGFLVPVALWVHFAAYRRVLQSAAVALASVAFFVATTFWNADHFLNNLAYASRLGWVYSWIGVWALALFLDAAREDGTPPPDWRPWRSGRGSRAPLALAVAGAPILAFVHILSAAQYLVSLGAAAWGWALARREPRPVGRALAWTPLVAAALALPFVALLTVRGYSTSNALFDHEQGLLYLFDHAAILGPQHLSEWLGATGLLAALLVIPLLRRWRECRGITFLVASAAVAALTVVNPIAVAVIERAHAHSLLFRLLWVAPIFALLGWFAVGAIRRLRDRGPYARRLPAALFLLLVGILAVLQARHALTFWTHGVGQRAAWSESAPLRKALAWLDAAEPVPLTVAADPIASYQIPAYSRHYAMAPLNQHSSPADSRAVERMVDATAILSPYVPLDSTLYLLKKHRARYVLLNQSYPRFVKLYAVFVTPLRYEAERAKFARRPDLFREVYGAEGVYLYHVESYDAAPEVIEVPFEVPATEGALLRAAGIDFLSVDPDSTTWRRGEPLRIVTYWRRNEEPLLLPVEAYFTVETSPSGQFQSPLYGKPLRMLHEWRTGEVLRFGRLHMPLEGFFPPHLWRSGACYRDEYWLSIPPAARPGVYTIYMKLAETPYAPVLRLSDFFRNDDSWRGVKIGTVRIGA